MVKPTKVPYLITCPASAFLSSRNNWTACSNTSVTACRFSTAPLGLPGRLRMRVRPRIPATARDSMACGVILSDSARMTSARPGASRSITDRVASGVTSRGAKPVPPVVSITSKSPRAHHSVSFEEIIPGNQARSRSVIRSSRGHAGAPPGRVHLGPRVRRGRTVGYGENSKAQVHTKSFEYTTSSAKKNQLIFL